MEFRRIRRPPTADPELDRQRRRHRLRRGRM